MKIKSVLVITILFIHSIIFAQQKKAAPQKGKTSITQSPAQVLKGTIFFDATDFDFAKVDEDQGRKQTYFSFKNIGKGDLHIESVETGCGCTTADWDKSKIYKQGESGKIAVSFNPQNLEGKFSRTITVKTDGDPQQTFLSITGDVFGPTKQKTQEFPHAYGSLRFSMDVFSMKHVLADRHDSIMIQIYNSSNKKIQLKGLRTPTYFRGKLFATFIEPKGYEVIKFVLLPEVARTYGPIEDQVVLLTDDSELPNKTIFLKADIVENFATLPSEQKKNPAKIVFKEIVKDLGEVYYGEIVDFDFEVTNKGKSDLILRRAYGTCGCTVGKVSTEPIKKGKKGTVSVRFDAKNLVGDQVKTITVISNDPVNTYTTLTLKAKLVEPGMKK